MDEARLAEAIVDAQAEARRRRWRAAKGPLIIVALVALGLGFLGLMAWQSHREAEAKAESRRFDEETRRLFR